MTKTLHATLVALAVAMLALSAPPAAAAQESHATEPPANHDTSAAPDHAAAGDAHARAQGDAHAANQEAGPVVPSDRRAVWPGIVLILIITMFALAAVIGPIARMHAPPAEMPVTHSHDEPPGGSHHHGHSGTINPEPDHHGGTHGHGHGHDHGHH